MPVKSVFRVKTSSCGARRKSFRLGDGLIQTGLLQHCLPVGPGKVTLGQGGQRQICRARFPADSGAFRELGVEQVISQKAIGSVNAAIRLGDIVISDDFLDKTKSRRQSLLDDANRWVRVDFTDPFCPRLRSQLISAARNHSDRVIERGVFVCTEGPRFETPAEIRALQREGGDIVGTPMVPEVIFAREAELCFTWSLGQIWRGSKPRSHLPRRCCKTDWPYMIKAMVTGGAGRLDKRGQNDRVRPMDAARF